MSKDFDTTLSDALDRAAHAAQTAGPVAARTRGRQRTMRKRIALSAASLVLVALGATVAFKVASSNSGTPNPTTTSPHVSASASASPNSSSTSGPTGAPSQVPSSATPSSPVISSPAVSSSPSSSHATAADPHQVVNAAWLTAGQLPFASTFHWKVQPAASQPLTATIFYEAPNDARQALTVCGDPANLLGRTIGAQGTQYFANPIGTGHTANQFVFFFADAASAQQTFEWLQGQYGPACMPGSGVTVTKTAGDGQTTATWLSRKGSTGPIDMAPYNREYFVLRGSTIGYVSISSTSNLPTAYDDASQLSTIAAHLCVYGGPCH